MVTRDGGVSSSPSSGHVDAAERGLVAVVNAGL